MTDKTETTIKRQNRKSSIFGRRVRKSSQSDGAEQSASTQVVFSDEIQAMEDYQTVEVGTLLIMKHEDALAHVRSVDETNRKFQQFMNKTVGSVRRKVAKMKQLASKIEEQGIEPDGPPNYESDYMKLYHRNKSVNVLDMFNCVTYLTLRGYVVMSHQYEDNYSRRTHKLVDDNVIEPHLVSTKAEEVATSHGEKIIDVVRKNIDKVIETQKMMHGQVNLTPRTKRLYPPPPVRPTSPTSVSGPTNVWKSQSHAEA
jgi:hypothetical protein